MVQVDDWEIDARNRDYVTRRVTLRQLYQLLSNDYTVVINRRGRTASHMLIGRDHGGACIAVPMLPTIDPVIWRPVSAWYCKSSEAARLRQEGI